MRYFGSRLVIAIVMIHLQQATDPPEFPVINDSNM